MTVSGDLFGETSGRQQAIERLFFGLMPTREAATKAEAVLAASRREFGLAGPAIRAERMHVTLIHVGDYEASLPPSLIAACLSAGEAVSGTPFAVEFDRAGSFAGAPRRHPHVLLGEAGVGALRAFRRSLLDAVIRQGVKPLSRGEFTPHVTLAYGHDRLPARDIEPVAWRATDFVLIHSEVGRSVYHTLGCWPLEG